MAFQLRPDDWIPVCARVTSRFTAVYGLSNKPCPEGRRFSSILSKCITEFSSDQSLE